MRLREAGRGWVRLGEAGRGWERLEEAGRGWERLGEAQTEKSFKDDTFEHPLLDKKCKT